MAQVKTWIAKAGPFSFDNALGDTYPDDVTPTDVEGFRTTGQGLVQTAPTKGEHVIRLKDLNPILFKRLFVEVANIDDPSPELSLLDGTDNAGVCFCYQVTGSINLLAGYVWDGFSTAGAATPYRVAGKTGFWLGFFRNVVGQMNQEGNHNPADDNVFSLGIPALRWLGYFYSLTVDKVPSASNDAANKAYVDAVAGSGVANVQVVSVASIANPATELAGLSNSLGSLVLAYQAGASANDNSTLYVWDASAGTTNSPYVVAGSGGKWIAIAGAKINPNIMTAGSINAGAGITATTIQASTILSVTGASTLAGIVSMTGQPACRALFAGSQTISNATDTQIIYGTEDYDQISNFATSTFTVGSGQAGKYEIIGQVKGTSTNAGYLVNLKIYKNSVDSGASIPGLTGGTNFVACGAEVLDLAVGDTLKFYLRHDSGGNITLTNSMVAIRKVL